MHSSLICAAAPALAISPEHGQLRGEGLDGFYDRGRRVLASCQLRLSGQEPVPLQGRMVNARQARFLAAARTPSDNGPDPQIMVERLRSADGTERITVRSCATRPLHIPLELRLGTDLAQLGTVAAGASGVALTPTVHGNGLRWSDQGVHVTVTAHPGPDTAWASAGVLQWEWQLDPGESRCLVLGIKLYEPEHKSGVRLHSGRLRAEASAKGMHAVGPPLWEGFRAEGDDPRVHRLLKTSLDDLGALLLRAPESPSDLFLAAGMPWRCSLAPAESLRAARMLLPLGTALAAGTMRTLARSQHTGRGSDNGKIPGTLRHAGPGAAPRCTGIEATLLLPTVLAEARYWGLPERDVEGLLSSAESCLRWMLKASEGGPFLPDPAPHGPYRCEVQAQAHRAAVLGAELLDACGKEGGAELRDWAAELRTDFAGVFWCDAPGGGRPLALLSPTGARDSHLGSAAVELLDTGLSPKGQMAPGMLDPVRTEQLGRLLNGPQMDSGWGLRSLGDGEDGHNPLGHRTGAVRIQETATAVTGLLAAGYEREACSLLRGVVDAAERFGYRLPEMYAAEQRTEGSAPLPHPAACRPSAVAAAGAVQLLTALAGVRPDAPAGTVAVRPVESAPLGALRLSGLRVAEEPFAVRISRAGMAVVEEAAERLHLSS
ncbi:amylo-alpha-1,6-glucosidase [Streptomyces axinellae]|uniref:Amylo-alpha-1,6-glucosidase n=1 Tax=Streptomyces axinellae TaxID=552788 RepID=A0ABN3QG48_9ACTN